MTLEERIEKLDKESLQLILKAIAKEFRIIRKELTDMLNEQTK